MLRSYTKALAVPLFVSGLLLAPIEVEAQQVGIYAFSEVSGTYAPIIGGTVLGNNLNNAQRFVNPAVPLGQTTPSNGEGFPIGFPFVFQGQTYDRVGVAVEGWISLGNSADGVNAVYNNNTTVPLSTTGTVSPAPASARARISAFGRDLRAKGSTSGSDLRIETIGTAPNRVCVVQWTDYERSSGTQGANGDVLNFQIRLNETTNVVDIQYGSNAFGATVTSTIYSQVGLGGTTAAEYNNRETLVPHDWNTTTAGTTNTATCKTTTTTLNAIVPTNGRIFRWTPPNCLQPTATATAVPACGTNQYNVSVNITDIGTGNTSLAITTDLNGLEATVTTPGITVIGPFALGTPVAVSIVTSPEAVCTLPLGTLVQNLTDCPITSYPYCQNFDTFGPNSSTTSCTNTTPSAIEGWNNVGAPVWLPWTGSTGSGGTGPTSDNTSGSGKYLYVEASGTVCPDRVIRSNTFDISSLTAGNGAEVSFFFHQWSDNLASGAMGGIDLLVEDVSTNPGVFVPLFSTVPGTSYGTAWQFSGWLDVDAVVTGPLVRFRFRGYQGSGGVQWGDVAIDDVCVRQALNCVPPTASATSSTSCTTNDFSVTVDLTGLGDAATVDIAETVNGGTQTIVHTAVSALTQYAMGPYALGSTVDIEVIHPLSVLCNVPLGSFTNDPSLVCVDCTSGLPVNQTYCYVASDSRSWDYAAQGAGVLRLNFNRGTIESSTFDRIYIFDGPDNTFPILWSNDDLYGGSPTGFPGLGTGNLGPDGSAILSTAAYLNPPNGVDVVSTGAFLHMEMVSDGSVQCATSTTTYDSWDWNVTCIDCLAPVAAGTIVPACGTNEFGVDVALSGLGTAPNVDILVSVNGGPATIAFDNVSVLQTYAAGPFNAGDIVDITVTNNANNNCDVPLGTYTYICPLNTFPNCEDFDSWTNCSTSTSCTQACPLEDGWSNVNASTWRTWSGSTGSTGTGPTGDHTSGAGKYLYIETSGLCPDRVAESPLYDISSLTTGFGAEVSAWYHMWDNATGDMGTFSIDVEDVSNAPGVYQNLFTLSGDQGNQWNFTGWLDVDAQVTGPIVRFRVTGTNTLTFNGDMAFDDFCVRESLPCTPVVATVANTSDCSTSTFSLDVDLTSIGSATTVDIVEVVNGGTPTVVHTAVSALQVYTVGPYANTASVQVSVLPDAFPGLCGLDFGPYGFDPTLQCANCTSGLPINETYCYVANDSRTWTYGTVGVGVLQLQFTLGTIESNSFDELTIYDGPDNTFPILFQHGSTTANLGPVGSAVLSTAGYETVDVLSTGAFLHMEMSSDGSVQCATSTNYDTWNWNVICIDCLSPVATATQNLDCGLGSFTVDVDLTGLGTSATVDIVETVNGGTQTVVHNDVSALQNYAMGPYLATDVVAISVLHASNTNCDVSLGTFDASITCITCGGAIVPETYCYVANDNESWDYFGSGVGQMRLRFNRGTIESASFDRIYIFDGPDNTFPILWSNDDFYPPVGGTPTGFPQLGTGNLGPVGSAILSTAGYLAGPNGVDVIATGQYIHMEMSSDGSVQCATSTTSYDSWDWEVFCFDCIAPTAAASVVPNCSSTISEFTIEVDLTSLGSATNVDIVDNITGVVHDDVSLLQIYQMGPYASGTAVTIDVLHNDDALCDLPLGTLTYACPPTASCGLYSSAPNDTLNNLLGPAQDTILIAGNPGALVTDMDVIIEITHPFTADLDITLTSPSGTVIGLMNDLCGGDDDVNVRFNDQAATTVDCSGTTIFGEYQTSGTLATLLSTVNAEPIDGPWTLTVTDDASGVNNGTLVSWCLVPTFVAPDCPDTPSGLSLVGTSFDQATLTWTPGATNTGYSIEYGPQGFAPGSGLGTQTGSLPPPVTVTGLPSGVALDFYLTETCTAGNALPIGPVTGTTLLLVNTYPYCESYDSFSACGTGCTTVCTLPATSGWVNSTTDGTGDWLTDAAGTGSSGTGPSGDNTSGSGNYLYLETSGCAGQERILTSPAFDVSSFTNQPVVSFAYHMYGATMGTLIMEIESPAGSGIFTQLFNLSGDQGNQWNTFTQPLVGYANQIAFRVRGITGTSFTSDMAIDDFCVTESPCFLPQFTVSQVCPTSGYNPYELIVTVGNTGGVPVDITTDLGGSQLGAVTGNAYSLGFFANATAVTVTVTNPLDPTCAFSSQVFTGDCSPTPTDDCTLAPALTCGDVVSGSTVGLANTLPANACPFLGASSLSGTAWYSFTATADEAVTVSTCNFTDFDSRISVFQATPNCSNLTCVALNDDQPGCGSGSSEVRFPAILGQTYYIVVHGSGFAQGNYTLAVTCAPPCTPASSNDLCTDAEVVSPQLADGTAVFVVGDNGCAYPDANPSCNITGNVQGVWYSFNTGSSTLMTLTLEDNNSNAAYTAVGLSYVLFSGSCTSGLSASSEIGCGVNALGSTVLPALTANTDYLLLIYNAGGIGAQGTFGFKLEFPPQYDASVQSIDSPNGTVCTTTIEPTVTLENLGEVTLTNVVITYTVDGLNPVNFLWTGSLGFNQTESVELPASTVSSGPHTIEASTSLPNGETDQLPANDGATGQFNSAGQAVTLIIRTDQFPGETSWEIYDPFFFLAASGGGYGIGNNVYTESLCLSTDFGNCFSLYLYDSFGDGICCTFGPGYWELRTPGGEFLLRDLFEDPTGGFGAPGDVSPSATPLSPGYISGHEFCLPAGPAPISSGDCGVFTNTLQSKVFCAPVAGVNSYQFEFSDPDVGFRRRIAVTGRNWVKFSEMVTTPLVPGTTYFARSRADQGTAGFFDDHFGPGCEMGLDPAQVPGCTQLIDDIGIPTHSCGVSKLFGAGDKLYALPTVGATQYRFRFENAGEGFVRVITRPNYILLLNWVTLPLQTGVTYSVQVEVLVNGIWSGYCGNACNVTIAAPAAQGSAAREIEAAQNSGLQIWPNPVRDGQVNILLSDIADQEQNITIDVIDLFGKRVHAQQFNNSGDVFNTVLELDGLAAGMYVVTLTVNDRILTERITVQ